MFTKDTNGSWEVQAERPKRSSARRCRVAGTRRLLPQKSALRLARELENAALVCGAAALLARIDPTATDDALAALREHEPVLGRSERLETRFVLWQATGDAVHLEEARRLLQAAQDLAPEEHRESMIENVPLNRDILRAWEEHEG